MGIDSVGGTLLGVRTRERLRVKMRVMLRAVSLALVYRVGDGALVGGPGRAQGQLPPYKHREEAAVRRAS